MRNLGRDFHSYCFISDVKKTVKRAGGGVGRDTDWICMDLLKRALSMMLHSLPSWNSVYCMVSPQSIYTITIQNLQKDILYIFIYIYILISVLEQ